MKLSVFLFRYRMVINMVIIVLGFWSPWIQYLGLGSRILLLEWLALEIARIGLLSFTVARSLPSTSTAPLVAVWNPHTKLIIVDFPDPLDPTSAVTVPGFDSKLIPCSTGFPASYSNTTSSNTTSPLIVPSTVLRRGSESSSLSAMISVVRSSPASASVNCVPTETNDPRILSALESALTT